jgi:hypothetical protein
MQLKIPHAIVISIGTMFALSCNEGGGSSSMKTKEDSLAFARAVMERYPERATSRAMMMAADSSGEIAPPEIAWDSVVKYRDRYDKNPFALEAAEKPINGYVVDESTYALITGNPDIKSLFLAFGRKADESHTIMLLGLDADGKMISDDAKHANYDYSSPCPDRCP